LKRSKFGENLPNSPKAASQNVLPADGVWVGANAVRRTTATKAKTADLKNPTVSSYILAAQPYSGRTVSIILPNTIHGCKKLNLGRSG
jgi:hypothetical protein